MQLLQLTLRGLEACRGLPDNSAMLQQQLLAAQLDLDAA